MGDRGGDGSEDEEANGLKGVENKLESSGGLPLGSGILVR